ncbi:MAG: hypothetical protein EA350_09205 [Gemmatimonadales bacterium]|nr:MAG: hypothetical protein EA350_09205 [Gemmatimonadales bacterium]
MKGRIPALIAAAVLAGACSSPAGIDLPEGHALYANIQGTVAPGTAEDLSSLRVVMRVEYAGLCEERQTGLAMELAVDESGSFSRMPLVVSPGLPWPGICLVFELRDGTGAELTTVTLDEVTVHGQTVTPDTIFVRLP